MDDFMGEAAINKVDHLERFDRLLDRAKSRRDDALYNIERHREALASNARLAVSQVEDAELVEVEPEVITGAST